MQTHEVYDLTIFRQVPGSGHTARENHHVRLVSSVELDLSLELSVGHVRNHRRLVGTGHELVVEYRNSLHVHASTSEDIESRKRFDFLETICKKNIYSFHFYKYCLQSQTLYDKHHRQCVKQVRLKCQFALGIRVEHNFRSIIPHKFRELSRTRQITGSPLAENVAVIEIYCSSV